MYIPEKGWPSRSLPPAAVAFSVLVVLSKSLSAAQLEYEQAQTSSMTSYHPVLLFTTLVAAGIFYWVGRIKNKPAAGELKKSRAELEEANQRMEGITSRLMAVYEAVPAGLILLGPDYRPLDANAEFFELLGMQDRGNCLDKGSANCQEAMSEALSLIAGDNPHLSKFIEDTSHSDEHEIEIEGKSLELLRARIDQGSDLEGGMVWVLREISREKDLKNKLVQSQKMEALGTMAGGVAHDFNNLLCGVLGNIDFARVMMAEGRDIDPYLSSAEKAARRGADLVKKLLSFSRRSTLQTELTDMNDLIGEVLKLIMPGLASNIKIEQHLDPELCTCDIDPTYFEQVLLNLCVNARDAMSRAGGTLSIYSSNTKLPESKTGEQVDAVEIVVEDSGGGIPEEHLPHIFDPFYTTKAPGEGTGLGLAMAEGIIEQMGGSILCETDSGKGTRFYIYLPAHAGGALEKLDSPALPELVDFNDKKILLVDDDRIVRTVARQILIEYGAKVSTAPDGEQALDKMAEAAQSEEGLYDVLVMDWSMPVKNAPEVLKEMSLSQYGIPVLLMTGQALEASMLRAAEEYEGEAAFMEKPFDVQRLTHHLAELISAQELKPDRV